MNAFQRPAILGSQAPLALNPREQKDELKTNEKPMILSKKL